jgi:nucleoside-diphosphate-sugar epimerase
MSSSGRVLLTGATGFIGVHLHRALLDQGHAVTVLVRPGSPGRARLDSRCHVRETSLTDVDNLTRALAGVSAVIYAAGAVRGRGSADFEPANVTGVASMVEALRRVRARGEPAPRLVLVSSLAATRPELSPYAATKRRGEAVVQAAEELDWTVLRPPAVYGPGDTELRPLLEWVRRGVALRPGPPDQRLALIHVSDLVAAVMACLAHPETTRQRVFTVDDGKPGGYDWQEIGRAVAGRRVRQLGVPGGVLNAAAIANQCVSGWLGRAPMLTPGKVRELQQSGWLCDNRDFTEATGWQPEIDLARGAAALFR